MTDIYISNPDADHIQMLNDEPNNTCVYWM